MKKLLLPIITSLILWSCANIVPPSGGDKDTTPPEVIGSNPPNESTQFSNQRITIQFDEYVKLNDAFNQVVISPPLNAFPEIKTKGKSIVIDIDEELIDSTTYTIQFGSSIGDITENNRLENFVYAFSTGDELDSLEIKGSVVDAYTGEVPESAIVVVYPATSDTGFTTMKPTYFTKVDKYGSFSISHVKEGSYNIYGLSDQNFNYYYDLPNESIAFNEGLYEVDSNLENLQFRLFQEDNTILNLIDIVSNGPRSNLLVFNKPVEKINFQPTEKGVYFARQTLSKGDSIIIWSNGADTVRLQTIHTTLDSLIEIKVKPADSSFLTKRNPWKDAPLNAETSSRSRLPTQEINKPLTFKFEVPIQSINKDSIALSLDSGRIQVPFEIKIDTIDNRNLVLESKWLEDTTYTIQLKLNAANDIWSRSNDSIQSQFNTRSKEDYGTLIINIHSPKYSGQGIGQLIDKSDRVVDTYLIDLTSDSTKITIPFLLPNTFRFRCILDENGDGIWTTGNFQSKKQPERIIYYPAELQVRRNWEYESKFNLND